MFRGEKFADNNNCKLDSGVRKGRIYGWPYILSYFCNFFHENGKLKFLEPCEKS